MAWDAATVTSLERENALLRVRVANLERRLARFRDEKAGDGELGTALSERAALLAEAEHIARMGSWVWDVPQNVTVWSDELFRILGYDPATSRASPEAFFARVHPEDLERVRQTTERSVSTGIAEQVDYRILLPDATERYVTMNAALLFDAAGILHRAVGTVLDVTESRTVAQELLRAHRLLEETQRIASTGSWEWNLTNGKMRWSRQLYRLFGLPEDTPASAEIFEARLHPDDQVALRLAMARLKATGYAPAANYRMVLSDGATRTFRFESEPVTDDDGRLLSLIGTATDITERLELEERLRQAQKLEAIGKVAGGLAHDFNNLLTIILANIDLLKLSVSAPQALEDIEVAAQAAADLTARLLAFSRRAATTPRVVDLAGVLDQFGPVVARSLGSSIETYFDVSPGPHLVEIDPSHIQQVFLNLALNSRDAMPGGGRLAIKIRQQYLEDRVEGLSPGAHVVVEVKDTGHGMDAETLSRAFEPFFTNKPLGRGTGLGLATVYGTMKQANGAVTVESEPGVGTIFRLYFPLLSGALTAQRGGLHGDQRAATLLVEDDDAVRKVVGQILRSCGQDVLAVRDANEALSIWDEHKGRISLLVSDINMAGMQGPELAAKLAAVKPELRILMLTGYSKDHVKGDSLPPGARILHKPFRVSDIVSAIAELTG